MISLVHQQVSLVILCVLSFTKKVICERRSSVLSRDQVVANILDWIDNESEGDVDGMHLVCDFKDEASSNEGVDAGEDNKDDIPVRPPMNLLTK